MTDVNRRTFLKSSTTAAGILASTTLLRANGANERLVLGVMGASRTGPQNGHPGRGGQLAVQLAGMDDVHVAYICDVDERYREMNAGDVAQQQGFRPQPVADYRAILDDRNVDAMVIATANHWHAPATIAACAAGKHVYVEKPGSHNPREAFWMVEAARKYNRRVQLGTQRRSSPGIREGIQRLHEGAIGRVTWARTQYTNLRPSIGRGQETSPPSYLDYELWQGPAPRRPYKTNLIHYNWHWHWHWGNGELGNNGVHSLDIARWGLQVDYPLTVTYTGGRYHHDDDQESPDTGGAVFDFGHCGVSWDQSSCHPRRSDDAAGVRFYGTEGTLEIRGGGYRIYDLAGEEIDRGDGPGSDHHHLRNFVEAVRNGVALHNEIEEGQKSSLLCHLGNIAYRTGTTVPFDPDQRRIVDNPDAQAFWQRDYETGWEPQV